MTNGDMVQKMFHVVGYRHLHMGLEDGCIKEGFRVYIEGTFKSDFILTVSKEWWDCKYKELVTSTSSLEKPNKWIQVKTALPEEGERVLVYAERNAYGDNGKYRKKVIDIGWQVDGYWHIDGCNGVVGIAWMQLPTAPNKSEIPTGAESEG